MKFDPKIELILCSLKKQPQYDDNVIVTPGFKDKKRKDQVAIVYRYDKYGMIAVNVSEYSDEDIVFFKFNGKLYDYCKIEGFSHDQMMKGFKDKVLRKCSMEEWIDYVLDK